MLKKNNNENYTIYVENIDNNLKMEIIAILEKIITNLNKQFNCNLVIGNIDYVEKTFEEKGVNYDINVFIYSKNKYTNRKINLNVSVIDDNIILNNIKNAESRNILVEERGGLATRGSVVYKPSVNFDNLKNSENINLEYSNVNYSNKLKNNVNRIKTILPGDYVDNKSLVFPNRKIYNVHNKFGIKYIDNKKNKCGIDHSANERFVVPNFYISNFSSKLNKSEFDSLFDLAQDSASRPVGVTGARG